MSPIDENDVLNESLDSLVEAAEAPEAPQEAPEEGKPARTARRRSTRNKAELPEDAAEATAAPEADGTPVPDSLESISIEVDAPVETQVLETKGAPKKDAEGSERGDGRRQRRPRNNGDQPSPEGAQGSQKGQQGASNGSGSGKGSKNKNRRQRRSNHEPVAPRVTREELEELKLPELKEKAAEFEIDLAGLTKKADIIEAIVSGVEKADGLVACEGILDLLPEGYGFLRTSGYLPGENDIYVPTSTVRKNALRKGDCIVGQLRPARDNEKYPALNRIDTINGQTPEESRNRVKFADLTPLFPDERLVMEHGKDTITARTIDLVAPIGKGQRGLIVSPPKAGKTTILKDIAHAIAANDPDVHLMCLLIDERPEEVTDMERSIEGEVISSTFDMPCENHIAVAELVIERAKRLVELGEDVVILLDSITRLARAYNLGQPASGRVLSGGVDSTALYPPKRFLGAARNIENGGSLTILASALIDTGSKMDEVIFEEFKGTGNMELRLDRSLADRRIFPAIDPVSSGTRKEELLLDPQEAPIIWGVRRILANLNNTERAMDMLIKSLKKTDNNVEFLLQMAKKAKTRSEDASL